MTRSRTALLDRTMPRLLLAVLIGGLMALLAPAGASSADDGLEIVGIDDGATIEPRVEPIWDKGGYLGYEWRFQIRTPYDLEAYDADGRPRYFLDAYVDGWAWGSYVWGDERTSTATSYPTSGWSQSTAFGASTEGPFELSLGTYVYDDEFEAPFAFEGTHELHVVVWERTSEGAVIERGGDSVTVTIVAPGSFLAADGQVPASVAMPEEPFTVDTPSVLSGLRSVQDVAPVQIAAAGGAAVALIAIAAYPGVLLSSTISANYDRIFGWAAPLRRRAAQVTARLRGRAPAWLKVAVGVTLTLLVSGFIDPRFGMNLGSVRIVASLAVSMLVEQFLFFLLVRRLLRRRGATRLPVIDFALGSLLFVAIAVLLTRITGFQPGIVFGLVLGLSFAVELSKRREGQLALAGAAYAFALGVVGWLLYSLFAAWLGPAPGALGVLLTETFSGFAVSGLAALPIALLPLAMLDGGAIWAWNRWVWGAAYVVSLFAVLVIVLPLPASWGEIEGPTVVWLLLFAGYCVVAVGVWALFRFALRPKAA